MSVTRTITVSLRRYLAAALVVALTIAAAVVFRRVHHANLPLLFLMTVLIVAARWGLWPSVFASLLSFLALNFFFTAPFYTFKIEEEGDFATLVLFLAMAGLTGKLAARMRTEMANRHFALEKVSALLEFSRRMTGVASASEAMRSLADRLAKIFHARTIAFLPDQKGQLQSCADIKTGDLVARLHIKEANSAWRAILENRAILVSGWTFLPLVTVGGPVGLVAVATSLIDEKHRELADGLCDQASIAVERASLVDSLKQAQVDSETEQLRSALLSSVSHDLRTPLASIIGSATSVLEYSQVLKPEDSKELLQTVVSEAQRLNRYIQNLLDMTRFGRQPFELHSEWADLNDLVSAAAERLCDSLDDINLRIEINPDFSLVKVHRALMEQVFTNLLDNAQSFAPKASEVLVRADRKNEDLVIEVIDQGPGIPEHERGKVFDMFYRVTHGDRVRPGTGIGLAICLNVIKAHGGTIEALPGDNGKGTTIRMRLPISAGLKDTRSNGKQ